MTLVRKKVVNIDFRRSVPGNAGKCQDSGQRARAPRQGVGANTQDLFRNGAVGFIDWLDGAGNHEALIKAVPLVVALGVFCIETQREQKAWRAGFSGAGIRANSTACACLRASYRCRPQCGVS
jgi:hypothetical protein